MWPSSPRLPPGQDLAGLFPVKPVPLAHGHARVALWQVPGPIYNHLCAPGFWAVCLQCVLLSPASIRMQMWPRPQGVSQREGLRRVGPETSKQRGGCGEMEPRLLNVTIPSWDGNQGRSSVTGWGSVLPTSQPQDSHSCVCRVIPEPCKRPEDPHVM